MFKKFAHLSLLCFILSLSHTLYAQPLKTNAKPNLVGIDCRGTKINLHDHQGKTVLISFYSAGCSVCARDLKLMREFYRDNHGKNFVLIGVNTDKTQVDFLLYTKILSASIPKNQQFPLIWQGNAEHLDGFNTINSDPTHFLITPNGQLSFRREGSFRAEDWDNLWESLNP